MGERKKSGAGPAVAIALIAVLAGAGGYGLGFGGGRGVMPGQTGTAVEENTETAADPEQNQGQGSESAESGIRYVEITINEDGYIYQNTKQDLEDILADVNDGDVINLTVHRASKNDVDALMEAAEERGIKVNTATE